MKDPATVIVIIIVITIVIIIVTDPIRWRCQKSKFTLVEIHLNH